MTPLAGSSSKRCANEKSGAKSGGLPPESPKALHQTPNPGHRTAAEAVAGGMAIGRKRQELAAALQTLQEVFAK
jgi:hypothetical protein